MSFILGTFEPVKLLFSRTFLKVKKIFFGALIALFFAQCSSQQNSEKILTRTQMVSILTDIHILEGKIQELKIKPKDSARKVYNTYEQKIFDIYGVTKSQYEKSYTYYVERPVELAEIYAIIVDSLNVREQEIKMLIKQEDEEKRIAREDSLHRIDSIQLLADTLDIPFDSIVFLGDSLAFNLDSLGLSDSLFMTFGADSLVQDSVMTGEPIILEEETSEEDH